MTAGRAAADAEVDARSAYPPAPAGQIIYVIGDIHGRSDLLEKVLLAIDADKACELAKERAPAPVPHPRVADLAATALASVSVSSPLLSIEFRCSNKSPGEVAPVRKRESVLWRRTSSQTRPTCTEAAEAQIKPPNKETAGPESKAIELKPLAPEPCETAPTAPPSFLEIYLGDYIDRGDDPRGVVAVLIERAKHIDAVFLRGNHEQFLLNFLAGSLDLKTWKRFGALPTLQSYRVSTSPFFRTSEASQRSSFAAALPKQHARFIAKTVPYFVAGSYVFAHAGIRPGIPLERQHLADLTAIRRSFLEFEGDLGHIVVHGHTPVTEPEFLCNRINLDTSAYSTGRLTCLKIDAEGPVLLDALPDTELET